MNKRASKQKGKKKKNQNVFTSIVKQPKKQEDDF